MPEESPAHAKTVESPSAVPPEEDWVRRAQAGDASAFEAIVRHYAGAIYRHLYRMVLNREEAEDLTQEAFLRAYRHLGRLDAVVSLRAWLYTIATRVGLNALRSRGRRGGGRTFSYEVHVKQAGDLEAPQSGDPVKRLHLQDELGPALAALPPRSALLVQLHYTEGFTIREAAALLGMSPEAAKVALCRARKELRQRLCEENES